MGQQAKGGKEEWGSVEHQRRVVFDLGIDPDALDLNNPADLERFRQAAFKAVTSWETSQKDRSLLATIFNWS